MCRVRAPVYFSQFFFGIIESDPNPHLAC